MQIGVDKCHLPTFENYGFEDTPKVVTNMEQMAIARNDVVSIDRQQHRSPQSVEDAVTTNIRFNDVNNDGKYSRRVDGEIVNKIELKCLKKPQLASSIPTKHLLC